MERLPSLSDANSPILAILAVLFLVLTLVLLAVAARMLRPRQRASAPTVARRRREEKPGERIEGLALAGADLGRIASGGGQYLVPWIGLIGAKHDAPTGLLPPRLPAPAEFDPAHRASLERHGRLAFSRSGLIIGFEDGLLDSGRWEARWRDMLRAARRCRGDRPLDSLVVAIPASALREKSQDALLARGEQIHELLLVTHRVTGWRLPIYFVVEGCEALEICRPPLPLRRRGG